MSPLLQCCVPGSGTIPCFCSHGSWVFRSFCILSSQLCTHAAISSSLKFLCILLLKERLVQVYALQQRVPGPSLSHFLSFSIDLLMNLGCLAYRAPQSLYFPNRRFMGQFSIPAFCRLTHWSPVGGWIRWHSLPSLGPQMVVSSFFTRLVVPLFMG